MKADITLVKIGRTLLSSVARLRVTIEGIDDQVVDLTPGDGMTLELNDSYEDGYAAGVKAASKEGRS